MRPSRPAVRALLALSGAALLVGWIWSRAAPCGGWENSVFGFRLWNESDPGGYYVPSAPELGRWRGRLLYPGHPGLTLQVLLRALQETYFRLRAPAGASLGFTAFTAKNIVSVFLLSKMMIASLHVLSFWLFLPFARRLLSSEFASLLAVLGYATSLPVVYYLTRVSVEPLMVVFFLAAFLCVWRCGEDLECGRPRRAILDGALSGAAAAGALATKFHLLWPLPAVCLLHLWWGDGARRQRGRGPAVIGFIAGASASFAWYCRILDWRDFFAYWDVGGAGGLTVLGGLAALVRGAARLPLGELLPARTRSGLFLFCEWPLLAAAAYGLFLEVRRPDAPWGRWFWLALAGSYTVLIWAYRCFAVSGDFHGFHYLFVFILLASVFFGRACDAFIARLPFTARWQRAAAAALFVAVSHAMVLAAARDAYAYDAAQYARIRAFGSALAAARAGERVGLVGRVGAPVSVLLGLGVLRDSQPRRSALIDAVDGSFIAGNAGSGPTVEIFEAGGMKSARRRGE